MNNSRKGAGKELQARKDLEWKGWTAADARKNGRFVKVKDLFGLFDIVAIHPGSGKVLFLQVTHLKSLHPHKTFMGFAQAVQAANIGVEQWAWVPRKGWKKYTYTADGRVLQGGS